MALGFFRKWQKSIIVIMVALMLSFLVGGTGMKILCDQGRNVVPRGESQFGTISHDDVRHADNDINILSQYLNLSAWSLDFLRLRQNDDNAAIAYVLLQQEASAAGYEVDDDEITSYLASIGLEKGTKEYARFLGRIERRNSGTTEPDLRATLGRWLMVMRAFNAYKVVTPPSDASLRKLFRDLNEKLTLRIVSVSAEKYADAIPDPTEKEINEQFAKYSKLGAGVFRRDGKGDTFGFGYAQPARVALAYLSVNSDAISRVTRPADSVVRDYYRQNAAQFVKAVPVTTQPAATSQPVATRPEQMSLDEAWEQIVERLAGATTDARTEEFVQLLQINVDAKSPSADRYKKVHSRMFDSAAAGDILSRSISAADIASLRGKPLAQAIPLLARAAKLEAICYPWETEGEFSVSRDTLVPAGLQADVPRTLAIVLDEITRLLFVAAQETATTQPTTAPGAAIEPAAPQYPKLKWTTCQGFAKVIFPVGPDSDTTILPITIGQTMLLSANKLAEHKEIGSATSSRTGRGSRLVTEAMKAKPLTLGRTMHVSTATGQHQILWQVVESRPAATLKAPVGDVRKDVIRDYKILQAYKTTARGVAENLAKKAATIGLEAAAKETKFDHYDSDPTARLSAWSRRDQIIMQARYMGMMSPPAGMSREEYQTRIMNNATMQAMNHRPREYSPSMVKDIDVKTLPAAQRFIDRIFDETAQLVPLNIEAPIAPDAIGPVISIPMPTARAHYVVQRIGYTPAVVSDFKGGERKNLVQTALDNSEWDARQAFFNYTKIVARAKYKLLINKKAAVDAP